MKSDIPNYPLLIEATYRALKNLDGSGKNDEINQKAVEILSLSDDVLEVMHTDTNLTEVDYRLVWARTCLKNYGAISNSARAVWSINAAFTHAEKVNGSEVYKYKTGKNPKNNMSDNDMATQPKGINSTDNVLDDELPDEVKGWRQHLHNVLLRMDPYAFERLTQRLLRECGFSQVEVTKKSAMVELMAQEN